MVEIGQMLFSCYMLTFEVVRSFVFVSLCYNVYLLLLNKYFLQQNYRTTSIPESKKGASQSMTVLLNILL